MTDRELCERLRSGRWLGETTGKPAADRIEVLSAENAALYKALSDDSELLTIAWMDGLHRSTQAHRETIKRLIDAGDKLNEVACHQDDCEIFTHGVWSDPIPCTCGYTEAWKAWQEARGA